MTSIKMAAASGVCRVASGLHDSLTEAYKSTLNATLPRHSAEELACVILRGVRAREEDDHHGNGMELSCVSLTVIGRTISMATAHKPEVASFNQLALKVLFDDMDAMSLLVANFGCEEQFISHLAAKSAASWVLYQLRMSGSVSPAWRQTCERAFLSSPAGPTLDACLWSLSCVFKRLLKDNCQELVKVVLMAFDASVSALASRFLPVDAWQHSDVNTFCLLLDLLELLSASSETCTYVSSQKLTHVHAATLMAVISCSPQYFVSKRAALLLKRAALRKAGEDWLVGAGPPAPSHALSHEHGAADIASLARTVLDGVAADWLLSIRVGSASFFGGTSSIGGGRQGGDGVMLRAVSLLVIMCVERYVRASATGAEACGYLQALWSFLGHTEVLHTCRLLTLLFSEQDDDMMEAAKALFTIFLQIREDSTLDHSDLGEAACASGCNPHCHFLFVLQSVAFDHRVLLDFLISMETCFLEYLVRYLKYLRTDWRSFTAACQRVAVSPKSDSGHVGTSPGRSLVDYDPSDESDPDNIEGSHGWTAPGGKTQSNMAACQTLARAAGCLSKLRLLVAKLQTKKMFPYNAESLIKLLTQVETCEGRDRRMLDVLYEWFWWDRIWLPGNLTWTDLEDKEGRVYAKASHLYVVIPYAFVFLFVRYIFERWVATPLAIHAGVKSRVNLKVDDNAILKLYYATRSRKPAQADLDGLSKKSCLSVRQVERWFRRRRGQDRPGVLKKFTEASWRFVFYLASSIGGLLALYDKEWFYDTRAVWTAFPKQRLLRCQEEGLQGADGPPRRHPGAPVLLLVRQLHPRGNAGPVGPRRRRCLVGVGQAVELRQNGEKLQTSFCSFCSCLHRDSPHHLPLLADSLHVGVPPPPLPCLLWLLLLQRHAPPAPRPAPLLGPPHPRHAQEVYLRHPDQRREERSR
ncbi:protein Lines homolog 1 isoform X3 [Dunckerocampus dactyliophorus]|uniref:protein Lines homolog 1 isoform X3 n=1 Tax=Dunckerocampus dactyliophorus TaxID=161453 RepID=UPI0024054947|nr:protein Lines homolog 1 isoform X3 [Dunckerocampus dactyliophorus]